MSTISLRVSENEFNILNSYARYNNTSLSEIIRVTMLERIENEYDLKVFEQYENQKKSNLLKTRKISKLWEELEL